MAAGLQLLFVLIGIWPVWAENVHIACPASCQCLGTMVDCAKKGLESVPTDLPNWVTIL